MSRNDGQTRQNNIFLLKYTNKKTLLFIQNELAVRCRFNGIPSPFCHFVYNAQKTMFLTNTHSLHSLTLINFFMCIFFSSRL